MIISNVLQLTTPGTLEFEEIKNQIGEGKPYASMNDYITQAISQSYTNLETIRNIRP